MLLTAPARRADAVTLQTTSGDMPRLVSVRVMLTRVNINNQNHMKRLQVCCWGAEQRVCHHRRSWRRVPANKPQKNVPVFAGSIDYLYAFRVGLAATSRLWPQRMLPSR